MLPIFFLTAARDILPPSSSSTKNAGAGVSAIVPPPSRHRTAPRPPLSAVGTVRSQSRIGSRGGWRPRAMTSDASAGVPPSRRPGGTAGDGGPASPPGLASAVPPPAPADAGGGGDRAGYHLVWSPNFWKKMLVSVALWLAVVQYGGGRAGFGSASSVACRGGGPSATTRAAGLPGGALSSSVVLPLLSSGCCAIQLLVNALTGWGCAGFNSYLGTTDIVSFFCPSSHPPRRYLAVDTLPPLATIRTDPSGVTPTAANIYVETTAVSTAGIDDRIDVPGLPAGTRGHLERQSIEAVATNSR
jgi:hypothetical protein